MTPKSTQYPDGWNIPPQSPDTVLSGSAPSKASKRLSQLTLAVASTALALTTLAAPSEAEARTSPNASQTSAATSAKKWVKKSKKGVKKPKKAESKKSLSYRASFKGSPSPAGVFSQKLSAPLSSQATQNIIPLWQIAANPTAKVSIPQPTIAVTAEEAAIRVLIEKKASYIRENGVDYAGLKKIVRSLDDRARLANIFPLDAIVTPTKGGAPAPIGEMLQAILFDPDIRYQANPADALANFGRLVNTPGGLKRAEMFTQKYFPLNKEMIALLDTKKAAIAQSQRFREGGQIFTASPSAPFITSTLPVDTVVTSSSGPVFKWSPFRAEAYRASQNLSNLSVSPQSPRMVTGKVGDTSAATAKPEVIAKPVVAPPKAVVVEAKLKPKAVVVETKPKPTTTSIQKPEAPVARPPKIAAPIPTTAQLELPTLQKSATRIKAPGVSAPKMKLSAHGELFSRLGAMSILDETNQKEVLADPRASDRLNFIADMLKRPRLVWSNGNRTITNQWSLTDEQAEALAVSDTDRARYIAAAINALLLAPKSSIHASLAGLSETLKVLTPNEWSERARMRSHIELSLMILYASGDQANIAFADAAVEALSVHITPEFLSGLADRLLMVKDRPMSTKNKVPGRLRSVIDFNREFATK
jgi:hypothetical protein